MTAARAQEPAPDRRPAHRHRFGEMAFELVDDRPMVRQTCEGCGTVRRYRAWERYWAPGGGETRR